MQTEKRTETPESLTKDNGRLEPQESIEKTINSGPTSIFQEITELVVESEKVAQDEAEYKKTEIEAVGNEVLKNNCERRR